MLRILLTAALLLAATALPASAHDASVGDLAIRQVWARATSGAAKTGAAYMNLTNTGVEPDYLIAAETPVAKRAELHTHLNEEGVMKMRPVEAIEVAPGAPTVLQPGGLHVMLMGLEKPLDAGSVFPLTLTFERFGRVTVEVHVKSGGAMQHGHDGHKMN